MKTKKLNKATKKTKKWWLKKRKAFYKWLCSILATLLCVGCGTTKAVVSNPENGTYTTITITTNNPISTNVSPNVELKNKK